MLNKNYHHKLKSSLTKKSSLVKQAFSLVEISIVIAIVGILVAGIAKSVDLYQDFKLSSARNLTNNSIVNRINGLSLWLEATSEKSFTRSLPNNNDLVEQWNDINPQRTFKINVAQSDNGKKPTYVRNAINQLPALRFSNDELRSASVDVDDIFSTNKATIFLVQNNFGNYSQSTTMSWIPTLDGGDSQGPGPSVIARFIIHANGMYDSSFWWGSCCPTPSREILSSPKSFFNENKIYSFLKNGSNFNARLNFTLNLANTNGQSGAIPSSTKSPFFVGTTRGSSSFFFSGYIAEIIIFNRALTENQRYEVEKYLSKKWGIRLTN